MDDGFLMAISHSPAQLNIKIVDFIHWHLTITLLMDQSLKCTILAVLHLNVQSSILAPTMLISKLFTEVLPALKCINLSIFIG